MANTGKRYSSDFRAEVVRVLHTEKHSVACVAAKYGISEQSVYRWLEQAKAQANSQPNPASDLKAELDAAYLRIAELEETVATLKKATAIFMQTNRE